MEDSALRGAIYAWLARHGEAPSAEELIKWVGSRDAVTSALGRLHEGHALVLDETGAIRMALPFSAVPTPYLVRSAETAWTANCAWDALAIPVAVAVDAHIEAPAMDDTESVHLDVTGGRVSGFDGFVHFTVPARLWWDDIVET